MSRQSKSRRLTLTLDATLPFEALIQERLERLPKARRQDWLRTLLVEGFKQESRQLKKLERRSRQPRRAVAADVRPLSPAECRLPTPPAAGVAAPEDHSAEAAQVRVSWAALRRVIGT